VSAITGAITSCPLAAVVKEEGSPVSQRLVTKSDNLSLGRNSTGSTYGCHCRPKVSSFPCSSISTELILCYVVGFVDETRKVEREFNRDGARRNGSPEEYISSPEAASTSGSDLTVEKNHPGSRDATVTVDPCPAGQEEPLTHSHVSPSAIALTWIVAANPPDQGGILHPETSTELSSSASIVTTLETEPQPTSGQDQYPASHFPQALDQTLQPKPDTSLDCRNASQVPRSPISSWPLDAPQEAQLLRHFIDNVSCFVRFSIHLLI
jgi:hypothetical protein